MSRGGRGGARRSRAAAGTYGGERGQKYQNERHIVCQGGRGRSRGQNAKEQHTLRLKRGDRRGGAGGGTEKHIHICALRTVSKEGSRGGDGNGGHADKRCGGCYVRRRRAG